MTEPYDSLSPEELRHRYSAKWTEYAQDVLPLWVADMDFPIASEITAALRERLTRRIGYPPRIGDPELVQAILDHQAHFGWRGLEPAHVWFVPGVVPGLYAAVLGLTEPGDEIITHTPIYPPFLTSITDHGRVAKHNPLVHTDHGWRMDMAQLETLVTPKTKVLMLCNPHNPTGRVWSKQELEGLAEFVMRHDLLVISDELHADLIFDGTHVPFASLGPEIADRTVVLTGPCKTYTTAGLGIGAAISTNPQLLERMQNATKGVMAHPNVMSLEMWLTGLQHGQPWLEKTMAYLRGNRDYLDSFVRQRWPDVRHTPPEGTYLAWLDFRAYPFASRAHAAMLEDAKVGLNDGPPFGPEAQGFLRLNFATSRAILTDALERMDRAINAHLLAR